MKRVEIFRTASDASGTSGLLMIDKQICCATLEPPDLDNRPNVSSIPAGRYSCHPVNSSRHGFTYAVQRVPGRAHILFHAGTTAQDSEGCILLGENVVKVDGHFTVQHSAAAYHGFIATVAPKKFLLTIYTAYCER
jgi:hypothetical protein